MKKVILLATLTLLAASCSKERWSAQEEGTTAVTMSVNLPGYASKAYGSGTSATTLRYAVYLREDGSEDHKLVASGVQESAFNSLTATQSIDLAMGRTYDFVFWADSYTSESNSPYTFCAEDKTVSIDYAKSTAAGDTMDAFYGIKPGVTVSAGMNIEATLTRPFAQVNFGTTSSDLSTAAQTYGNDLTTAVRMKAYTSFGLLSGEASGETENDVTFAAVAPSENENFPVNGYKYLAVAYALVNDAETKDVTYVILDGGVEKFSNKVANVPLKKNYRTNIYGSLITSAANVTINISPNPGGDENEALDPWDGTTLSLPVYNAATLSYEVSNPSQLAGLAAYVNEASTPSTTALTKGDLGELDLNKPFVLTADIDLGGKEWTPIATGVRNGSGAAEGSKAFTGTFDGCGNTIKGLKISAGAKDHAIGLFGVISGGTVKNLNLTDVDINVPDNENAGAVAGLVLNGGTIEGVTVDGKVSMKKGGGVIGRMTIEGTIKDCVNNATISGTSTNVGGIVAAAYYTAEGKTMTIESCTNNGEVKGAGYVGGIAGLSSAIIKDCTNNAKVTGTSSTCVGGIVGEQSNAGKVSGCVNNADIANTSTAPKYGTGGIIGWLRYVGAITAYPVKNVIEVCDNSNYGSISGTTGVGGIVGVAYSYGQIHDNYNAAASLSGTTFIAGIVGGVQTDDHPGLEEDWHVYVIDNSSCTPLSAMTGGCKDLFVYINTPDHTTASGNTCLAKVTNTASAQAALDIACSGMTIEFAEGIYGDLELRHTLTTTTITKESGNPDYLRVIDGLTIKAAEGANVTIGKFLLQAGHIYNNNYNYVTDKAISNGNNAYYAWWDLKNIVIDGFTLATNIYIGSDSNTNDNQILKLDGFTLKNCKKIGTDDTKTTDNGNKLIRIGNGTNRITNVKILNCYAKDVFQGVYAYGCVDYTVEGCEFDNLGHNVFQAGVGNHLFQNNIIRNCNTDRIFRGNYSGSLSEGDRFMIKNNQLFNSVGDAADANPIFKGFGNGEIIFEGNTMDGNAWNPLN